MELSEATRDECSNCRYWKMLKTKVYGVCRRYPPTLGESDVERFPVLPASEWCGEHQPLRKEGHHPGDKPAS
jgi:hypothetical protein